MDKKPLYSSIPKRIIATTLDQLIVILLVGSVAITFNMLEYYNQGLMGSMILIIFLGYEPLQVVWRGGTIGHYYKGIRVLRVKTKQPPNVLIAFFRYIVKLTLGGFSLLFIFFTKREQALHDLITKTVVVEEYALDRLSELELPDDPEKKKPFPSSKRISKAWVFFVSFYCMAVYALFLVIMSFTLLPDCFGDGRFKTHTSICWWNNIIITFLIIGGIFAIFKAGSIYRLPGVWKLDVKLADFDQVIYYPSIKRRFVVGILWWFAWTFGWGLTENLITSLFGETSLIISSLIYIIGSFYIFQLASEFRLFGIRIG